MVVVLELGLYFFKITSEDLQKYYFSILVKNMTLADMLYIAWLALTNAHSFHFRFAIIVTSRLSSPTETSFMMARFHCPPFTFGRRSNQNSRSMSIPSLTFPSVSLLTTLVEVPILQQLNTSSKWNTLLPLNRKLSVTIAFILDPGFNRWGPW